MADWEGCLGSPHGCRTPGGMSRRRAQRWLPPGCRSRPLRLYQVGNLADLVDLALHLRNALGGLASMDTDALVGRGDWHLVAQLATWRINLSARRLRSASWRI